MGDREFEILSAMTGHTTWMRPLDVGGGTRSHHSRTLAKMATKGWVERKQRRPWAGPRGSWMYKLTAEGETLWRAEEDRRSAAWRAAQKQKT